MSSDSTSYDLRTFRRHIKSGRLTAAEYQAFTDALPDVSDNIMDPEEGGDDDGWDARNRADGDEPEAEAAAEAAPAAPAAADPFAPAPAGAPLPPVAAPVVPSAPAPSVNDAPAPPPPPLEVPIGGAAPIIPPKVD